MRLHWQVAAIFFALLLASFRVAAAADWPTFRHDIRRSGASQEQLPLNSLAEQWVYRARVAPRPAWAGPPKWDAYKNITPLRSMRDYDPVYHVSVKGKRLYFGSSGEDAVYCLDTAGGRELWSYTTDGPVRIAPHCEGDKIFFGSDDGCAYCLRAADGGLVWRFSPADRNRRILNDGRLIPLWPCRTGVLVADNTAYFACALLPWNQAYLCAVDAESGRPNGLGHYVIEHPGLTFEGAMLASATQLVSPQGQVAPLVFARSDGKSLGAFQGGGGIFATLTEDGQFFHGPGSRQARFIGSDATSRAIVDQIQDASSMVATKDIAYVLTHRAVVAIDRATHKALWTTPTTCTLEMILVGDTLFAGGQDLVVGFRRSDGKQVWQAAVRGKACGLAAGDGRLFVSTHEGAIHCFGAGEAGRKPMVAAGGESHGSLAASSPLAARFEPSLGPYLQFTGPDTAVVRWQTSEAMPTLLRYGLTAANLEVGDPQPKKVHEAKLIGLRKDMVYQYFLYGPGNGATVVSRKFECDTSFNSLAGQPQATKNPFPHDALAAKYDAAVSQVLKAADVSEGICLVIGSEHGRLAYELAARRPWRVIGLDDDPRRVEEARKNLRAAGLYGSQVTIHAVQSLKSLPMVEGLADVVVSDRELLGGDRPTAAGEISRILRPGGVAIFVQRKTAAVVRKPIPRAGVWTHEYGLPDNSAYGGESLAGASGVQDLRVQWVGRPGPRANADRNGRKPSPLAVNGRLFVQGLERITALSSYNGTILWSLEIPGFLRFNVPRDCSNWCADNDHVFAIVKDRCWQINAATGALEIAYDVVPGGKPKQAYDWGYVARQGNRLVGSAVRFGTQYTNFWGGGGWYDDKGGATGKICSDRLFAYDLPSGAVAWTYSGGLVIDSTVTINEEKVYFIESRNAKVVEADTRRVMSPELWQDQFLVALDLQSGKKLFERPLNTEQGNIVFFLAGSGKHLVLVASNWLSHAYGLDATNGQVLWKKSFDWHRGDHGGHMSRPAIVGDHVLVRPKSLSLESGEILPGTLNTGGCGSYACSDHAVIYRDGNVALWSPDTNQTTSWPRLRPDCWISAIPACGMLLSPEAGGGCSCGSWLETSIAFAPRDYPLPRSEPPPGTFLDQTQVSLATKTLGGVTRYTLDGSDPTPQSPEYKTPLPLCRTTTVKARTYWEKGKYGQSAESDLFIGTFTRDYPGPQYEPGGMPFLDSLKVRLAKPGKTGVVRYTLDKSPPTESSPLFTTPIVLDQSATIMGRIFYEDGTLSPTTSASYVKSAVKPQEAITATNLAAGLNCDAYEGDWKVLPDFSKLQPKKSTTVDVMSVAPRTRTFFYALRFHGYLRVPQDGIYMFYTASDDGSKLYVGGQKIVDNDGIHAAVEKSGWVALRAGLHPFVVEYWNAIWDQSLSVSYAGPGIAKQAIPANVLFHPRAP